MSDRWLVLYDGECGLCKWLLAPLLRWDRDRRLQPIALRTQRAAELLADLSEQQRLGSWHLIAPDGRRYSAGAALAPLLRLLPGGSLPARIPAAAPEATERAYRWVADHRSELSKPIPATSKRRAAAYVSQREAASEAARSG
jgi:predicted DCC family thiol-disulfide oxidoreductase YuxK